VNNKLTKMYSTVPMAKMKLLKQIGVKPQVGNKKQKMPQESTNPQSQNGKDKNNAG
jgi:hypothetical protein